MGAKQSKPTWLKSEGVVGALNLNTCKQCVPCCGAFWGGPNPCCAGVSRPSGDEWQSALSAGFQDHLDEAWEVAKHAPRMCGCCMDPMNVKPALDAEWTPKANEFLKDHGLEVSVRTFYTQSGAGLVLQFRKLEPRRQPPHPSV